MPHILTPLTSLVKIALHQGIQPDNFNTAFLRLVGKTNKDLLAQNKSHGIAIPPPLAKLYEHVIDQHETLYHSTVAPLQHHLKYCHLIGCEITWGKSLCAHNDTPVVC